MIATLLLLLLTASPAAAAERDLGAEAVATEAARVQDAFCSTTAGSDTTLAAQAVAEVSRVWAQVSEELDRSDKVYLVYWRGVLGECLSQEDRAVEDLQRFVDSRDGEALWASLVADARARLRRLLSHSAPKSEARPPNPGGVLGIALAGAAGAVGALSAWQWHEATNTAQTMYRAPHSGDQLLSLGAQGDQQQLTSRILVGSAAALGTAALVSWIVGGAREAKVQAVALPTEGGGVVVVAGRF